MTEERQLVVMAVLEGKLPIDMITKKELDELHEAVFDAVAIKKMSNLPHFDVNLH
jgi:hypothetical protein